MYNKFKIIEIILKDTSFFIIMLALLLYLNFCLIYGNRGVWAYLKLKTEFKITNNKLSTLRAKRLEIENRSKLLRLESLDIDMLDEKARSILGISSPNEQVFRKIN